jgi:hypothetical protein
MWCGLVDGLGVEETHTYMNRAEQRYPALRLHYQAKSGQLAFSVQRRTTCQMMNMMKRDLEALKNNGMHK